MTVQGQNLSRPPLISDGWGVAEWTSYLDSKLALQERGHGTPTTEACVRFARRKIAALEAEAVG